jgi:glyceraldehyde 3-phosphate dehydrogenase
MATRLAINGFGRVGRAAFRAAHQRGLELEFVAVNDLAPSDQLEYLLRHDSVYGRFDAEVERSADLLAVDGHELTLFHEPDPIRLPWCELDVDVVLECTGRFRARDDAAKHLFAGAGKVVVSAPMKDADVTVVLGVNFDEAYDSDRHDVISNASCTTNCLAPVAKVLHESVGIRHGLMTTIHAYTGDQRLVDLPHKDLRRARAAGLNLIPTTTGAAKAIGLVIPDLAGKLHGFAVRAPVPTGSLVDLTIEASRETSVDELEALFRLHSEVGPLQGILEYSDEAFVSSDILGSPYSAVFDAPLTTVVDGTQVKVVAWYDNECGYSNRLIELAAKVAADRPALVGMSNDIREVVPA